MKPMQALEQFKRQFRLFEQIVGKNIEKRVRRIEQHFEEKVERPFRLIEQRIGRNIETRLRRFEQKNGIRLNDEVRFIGSWIKKPLSMGAVTPSSKVLARAMARYVDPYVGIPRETTRSACMLVQLDGAGERGPRGCAVRQPLRRPHRRTGRGRRRRGDRRRQPHHCAKCPRTGALL